MTGIIPTDCHSLLTIYRSDLDTTIPSENDNLVLFQLPESIDLSDLPASRLVAATSTQQACWINETKGVSYAVSRVETSNAYIMVRPTNSEQLTKKLKRSMNMLQVQLLQRGGSGASFLELKEHSLNLDSLYGLLQQHVLDPFDISCDWKGLSIEEMATVLQVSQKQVMNGLITLQALRLMNRYGVLSEEGLAETQTCIIATLTEVDRFHELANIQIEECIREVLTRTEKEEHYKHLPDVIRYTLHTLQASGDDTTVWLDVTKVAQCVAHRLFRKQGIWNTNRFLLEWQLQMPGVQHQVHVDMLQGIAISLPNEQLIYSANLSEQERMQHIFAVKDELSRDELAPHFKGENWTKYCKLVTSVEGEQVFCFNKGEV